ncbi:MAG: glycosyltransferase family 2 protein [Deltaproteobacteria bacterium]|nr:glycosyltransferase family 2 protein [Deltaproteobacteria bacterium]
MWSWSITAPLTRQSKILRVFSPGFPNGTLLLTRRSCLLDIGLFDERFFAYGEENDLGLRAKAAGWEVGIVKGARVHNPATTSTTLIMEYLLHRNTLLLVKEHSGVFQAYVRLLLAIIELIAGLIRPAWRMPIFSVRGRIWGIVDFLRHRYGPPPREFFKGLDNH